MAARAARKKKEEPLFPVPDGMEEDPGIIPMLVPLWVEAQSADEIQMDDSAEQFITMCERDYPTAFEAWIDEAVRAEVSHLMRSAISRVRHQVRRASILEDARAKAAATEEAEGARVSPIERNGKFKKILSLTKKECLRIAEHRSSLGRSNLIESARYRLIAAKCPQDDSVVGDHWTMEEIVDLGESLEATPTHQLEGL